MKKLLSSIIMFIVLVMATASTVSAICEQDGYYADPDYCNTFHVCKDGVIITTGHCPDGTYYNPETMICDWADNVNCTGGPGKQCLKNPDDSKNNGDCYLRQDTSGSGFYVQVCETSWIKFKPCQTGASK
ncbi:chitin binding peritrophin-A domain-containing protein [Chitinophaga solisilvae]|uniref:chitin binding peritrophin-A domain-containing protein n=1 Tax=Chitinophaga solisilvae TaxID=1233460 RepID=UPI00136AABA8|nr:chitin binding peritrophin-A domain-containing protein [Chitinophaga solisilvae]